jgi:hypothetical protein
MTETIPPVNRRTLFLAMFLAPLACAGCWGEGTSENTQAGVKRSERFETLQKKAEEKAQLKGKRRPAPPTLPPG